MSTPSAGAPSPASVLRVRSALANLRREPSHAAELVSQLILGERATVLEEHPGWLRVAGPDGYPGWVDARVMDGADASEGTEVVWTLRAGLLRDAPDPAAEPLLDLTMGSRAIAASAGAVRVPGHGEAWADADGWVAARHLSDRFPHDAAAVVRTALSLRGVPYLWGGTSTKAFDCSGFVQRVLGLHGCALPRDAWQQADAGRPVDVGVDGVALLPGDLLFFAEGGTRVNHVAIALGERGRFVHCSTSRGGVGVDGLAPADPLHAPRLAAALVRSRRVLG